MLNFEYFIGIFLGIVKLLTCLLVAYLLYFRVYIFLDAKWFYEK